MSLVRPALNRFLRLTERRYLERVSDPVEARRRFEHKARLWFHAPCGTVVEDGALGGVPVRRVQGPGASGGGVLFYLHGGGYFMGSGRTHQAMLGTLSALTGLPACLPEYRLAPEHPFPAAYDDAVAAYRGLLAEGHPAGRIVLGGDSAGGGLALALLAGLEEAGLPPPRLSFAFSPLTDFRCSGASFAANRAREALLPATRFSEMHAGYLAGADPADPRASPLYARFTGQGAVLLYAGSTEILLDDSRRMADRLRRQGVTARLQVEPDLPHVWPIFHNYLPEARATLRDVARQIAAALQA